MSLHNCCKFNSNITTKPRVKATKIDLTLKPSLYHSQNNIPESKCRWSYYFVQKFYNANNLLLNKVSYFQGTPQAFLKLHLSLYYSFTICLQELCLLAESICAFFLETSNSFPQIHGLFGMPSYVSGELKVLAL